MQNLGRLVLGRTIVWGTLRVVNDNCESLTFFGPDAPVGEFEKNLRSVCNISRVLKNLNLSNYSWALEFLNIATAHPA